MWIYVWNQNENDKKFAPFLFLLCWQQHQYRQVWRHIRPVGSVPETETSTKCKMAVIMLLWLWLVILQVATFTINIQPWIGKWHAVCVSRAEIWCPCLIWTRIMNCSVTNIHTVAASRYETKIIPFENGLATLFIFSYNNVAML